MEEQKSAPRPLPGLGGLRIAAAQLLRGDDATPVDTSAVYYPLVGLALGAAMALLDQTLSSRLSLTASSLAVVALHVAATRGRPLRGLARTLALSIGGSEAGASRAIVGGLQILVFALAVLLVSSIDRGRAVALLYAPMLARCAMVVIATGSRQARADGVQVKFSRELSFREFGIASTLTFAVVFLTTHFLGLLLVLATGFLTIGMRLLIHWLRGGVDRDSLHGVGEAIQMIVLALIAAL